MANILTSEELDRIVSKLTREGERVYVHPASKTVIRAVVKRIATELGFILPEESVEIPKEPESESNNG